MDKSKCASATTMAHGVYRSGGPFVGTVVIVRRNVPANCFSPVKRNTHLI